jgi:flagellar hook-associated protein 3 FlgL
MIRANPPDGRQLSVDVTSTGLVIQLDAQPGNLSVREVGHGTTAAELGILAPAGVGNDPLVGSDLNPILRLTTRLTDLLGSGGGGGGIQPDVTSGLQIAQGGRIHTIDLSDAVTVEDLLNLLNASEANVEAAINGDANGIDIRSRLSGADFAIGENGGSTATQLGLRTFTLQTRLEDLNFGRGVEDYQGSDSGGADFTITRSDGVSFDIDMAGAETIGDLLERINSHPDNLAVGTPLVAQLAAFGNGIELVDQSGGAGDLVVAVKALSTAAVDLGLVPEGEESARVSGSGTKRLTGADVDPQETDGVFTALLRLERALEANDLFGIQRAVEMLDRRATAINFSRAELGAKQMALDILQIRTENEEVELRSALSVEHDADIVEVISDLTARQLALQASLQSTARIYGLTLLDYL